jgi:hypothetical protein
MNGRELPREFSIAADEPPELLGANTAPNPQLLIAAFNACIMVGTLPLPLRWACT